MKNINDKKIIKNKINIISIITDDDFECFSLLFLPLVLIILFLSVFNIVGILIPPKQIIVNSFDVELTDKYILPSKKTTNAEFKFVFLDKETNLNKSISVTENDYNNYHIGDIISIEVVKKEYITIPTINEIIYEINN